MRVQSSGHAAIELGETRLSEARLSLNDLAHGAHTWEPHNSFGEEKRLHNVSFYRLHAPSRHYRYSWE